MKDWNAMSPRERDALVAEKVMGREPRTTWIATNDGGKSCCASTSTRGPWRDRADLAEWLEDQQAKGYHRDYEIAKWESHPRYTTDIAAAWEVVEKMHGDGRDVWISYFEEGDIQVQVDSADAHLGSPASAPETICLAALRAMGVDV